MKDTKCWKREFLNLTMGNANYYNHYEKYCGGSVFLSSVIVHMLKE